MTRQTHAGKIEPTDLLEEGEVVEVRSSFRWTVTDDDSENGQAPESHLDPLEMCQWLLSGGRVGAGSHSNSSIRYEPTLWSEPRRP